MSIWHFTPLRFAPAFRALGVCEQGTGHSAKNIRDVSAIFLPNHPPPCFCRNVCCRNVRNSYQVPLGYVPVSSSALRPLGAAYIPILLSEVDQEQRPSGNGDREAIVVGAGLCDGEGEIHRICPTI